MFTITRLPNIVRAVFDTLIDDYKPVVDFMKDSKCKETIKIIGMEKDLKCLWPR